jgi:hypothetical protein
VEGGAFARVVSGWKPPFQLKTGGWAISRQLGMALPVDLTQNFIAARRQRRVVLTGHDHR